MSFLGQFRAMTNPEFYGRVWVACYAVAEDVANESPTTPNHELRARLAALIENEPATYADTFVKRAAMNATIGASISEEGRSNAPDSDFEFVIAQWWDSATALLAPASAAPAGKSRAAAVNVQDYGAKGDGVADDTAAIQDAINAAASFGLRVYVPGTANRYRVTRQGSNTHILTVPTGVTVFGDGATSHLWFDATVNPPASGAMALVVVMIGTPSSTSRRVRVTGLKVTGNNSAMPSGTYVCGIAARLDDYAFPAVDAKTCTDVEIDHNTVVDTILGIGMQPSASYAAPLVNASDRAKAGYLAARWNVHHNTVDTTTNKAIELSATTSSSIDSNVCLNVYDGPQAIYYSTHINITNNFVTYKETGISVTEGVKNINVIGNHLIGVAGSTQGANSLGGIAIRREPQADVNVCAEHVVIRDNHVDATATTSQRAFGFHRHVSSASTSWKSIRVIGNTFVGKTYAYDWLAGTDTSGQDITFVDNTFDGDFLTSAWPCNFLKIDRNRFKTVLTINTTNASWNENYAFTGVAGQAAATVATGATNNVLEQNYFAGGLTDNGTTTRKRANFLSGVFTA